MSLAGVYGILCILCMDWTPPSNDFLDSSWAVVAVKTGRSSLWGGLSV